MSVHFLASALDRWDETETGALALTFFADERPLRGAAGLADWRLCGRLSRLIKRGKIRGKRGETLLMPPGQRMTFPRVMLFGLGASDKFDEAAFRQHVRWIRDVLGRAGVSRYAIQPPGRATGLIAARRALELWLDEAGKDDRREDVAIIDAPGAQKEMAETLRKAQKQAARKAPAKPNKASGASSDREGASDSGATGSASKAEPPGGADQPATSATAATPATPATSVSESKAEPGAEADPGQTVRKRRPSVDDDWT